MPSSDRPFNSFRAAGTNGLLDFSLSRNTSGDPARRPSQIWSGSRLPRLVKESVSPSGEAQLAQYLKESVGGPLEWDADIQ